MKLHKCTRIDGTKRGEEKEQQKHKRVLGLMEGYNLKCTSSFESKEKASLRMAGGHKQDPVFPVKFIMSQKNLTCLHYLPQTVKIKHHKTFAVII